MQCKPHMILRLLQAKRRCKKENRAMLPKRIFSHLKGFMVAGTDNLCYKDDLEELWGIRPMELFAGTEPSIMGTETWTRKGMYFFPDTAFYEFITEKDMMRNYEDPSYIPPTYLMDEVRPGENTNSYLLFSKVARLPATAVVICIAASVWRTVKMRQGSRAFEYVDRVPWIIDIAGLQGFRKTESAA